MNHDCCWGYSNGNTQSDFRRKSVFSTEGDIPGDLVVTGRGYRVPFVLAPQIPIYQREDLSSRHYCQQQQQQQGRRYQKISDKKMPLPPTVPPQTRKTVMPVPKQRPTTFGAGKPSAARSGVLRPSGSVGNIAFAASSAASQSCKCDRRLQSGTRPFVCNCQHPNSLKFLEDLYVQNLRTQIETLELENTYLREFSSVGGAGGSRRRMISTPQPAIPDSLGQRKHSVERPDSSAAEDDIRSVLTEFMNEFRRQKQQGPASRPGSDQAERKPPQKTQRHVGFFNDSSSFSLRKEQSEDDGEHLRPSVFRAPPPRFETPDSLKQQRQRSSESLFNGSDGGGRPGSTTEKGSMEHQIRLIQEKADHEKRSLLDKNVELQARLDDLIPLLAEKEARCLRLENALDQADAKFKDSRHQNSSGIQKMIEERVRERLAEQEGKRATEFQGEVERLQRRLESVEEELNERQTRETNLEMELSQLGKRLETERMRAEDERRIRISAEAERETLSAELTNMKGRLEEYEVNRVNSIRMEQQKEREINELTRNNSLLSTQIELLEKQLDKEREALEQLKQQQQERKREESELLANRYKVQKELEALQALSESLARENKGLRQDRIASDELTTGLKEKLKTFEEGTKSQRERLRATEELANGLKERIAQKDKYLEAILKELWHFLRRHQDGSQELHAHASHQSQLGSELEALLKRVQREFKHRASSVGAGGELSVAGTSSSSVARTSKQYSSATTTSASTASQKLDRERKLK